MTVLPILLFILGVICLVWAMRMGDSSKSNQEILTVLQGLAGVKKEISKLQKDLREVESQVGDHELRLYRNENVQEELRSEVKEHKRLINQFSSATKSYGTQPPQSESAPQSLANPYSKLFVEAQPSVPITPQPSSYSGAYQNNGYLGNQFHLPEQTPSPVLPEKYQRVVELYGKGWSITDIAGHLSISRDAVDMILRTFAPGKELE